MADPKDSNSKDPEFIEDMIDSSDLNDEGQKSRSAEIIKKYNLSDRFNISVENPIKELSNNFARAFEVRDGKQKHDVYALVLPNSLPIRFKVIQQLRQFFSGNFTNVVDSGFSDVAKGEYGAYAVVLEKPRGVLFSSYVTALKQNFGEISPPGKILLDEDFITNNIVSPVNELLKMFADNDISHGRLNHENIYIDLQNNANIMVSECISEPCGFSQFHPYEVIERAQAMPLGKGNSHITNDYFALGVLIYYCIFGEMPGKNMDANELVTQRLHKGTYNAYLGTKELPPRITDILRGLLTDQLENRWGYEQVFNWTRGKKYNLLRPKLRKESVRNYEYGGISHSSKRQLAHTYFMKWDESAEDLRDRKLVKWLELSVNDKNTADSISSITIQTGGEKSRSRSDDDELVSKAIIMLDPYGPIRYRNISLNIEGVGAVLANAWLHQNQQEIQTLTDIIRLNLIDFKAVHEAYTQKIDRWVMQRLQSYIKVKSMGFGLERCLYDLNPSLPCQSTMMTSQFIVDINQLLYYLNDNATKLSSHDPVDRHVAAFICSRLDISREIKLKSMRHIHDEKAKNQLFKLAILAFAQRKSGASRLSGLGNWMMVRVKTVIDSLHSRRIRKEMTTEMKNLADQGNLEGMLQLISNSDYFIRDNEGFNEARRAHAIYDNELRSIKFRKGMAMSQNAQYQYGLYLAKIIGVVVFVVTLIIMMPKNVI